MFKLFKSKMRKCDFFQIATPPLYGIYETYIKNNFGYLCICCKYQDILLKNNIEIYYYWNTCFAHIISSFEDVQQFPLILPKSSMWSNIQTKCFIVNIL